MILSRAIDPKNIDIEAKIRYNKSRFFQGVFSVEIRKADLSELNLITQMYADARRFMAESGNASQWKSNYPPAELTKSDIERGKLYLCTDCGAAVGVFYFAIENEPDYERIYGGEWLNSEPYAVIHRVAVTARGKGVAAFCFDWCFDTLSNLKIDTHADNIPMQKALEKNGFIRCGTVILASGEERIAYQKTNKRR